MLAHDGFARSICPTHTSVDGDGIFALSVGTIEANLDAVGTIATEIVSEAIARVVEMAQSVYGMPSTREKDSLMQ